jgi:hypothetical protein
MVKKHISFFRFDVIQCGDSEKLIKKRQAITDPILYYAFAEEMYKHCLEGQLTFLAHFFE